MQYKIHQIVLNKERYHALNADSTSSTPLSKAYMQAMMGNIDAARDLHLFDHVATIEANDLNGVFHVGNVGPEEAITRIYPTTSLSVGNVIEDQDGKFHVVKPIGFEETQPV